MVVLPVYILVQNSRVDEGCKPDPEQLTEVSCVGRRFVGELDDPSILGKLI